MMLSSDDDSGLTIETTDNQLISDMADIIEGQVKTIMTLQAEVDKYRDVLTKLISVMMDEPLKRFCEKHGWDFEMAKLGHLAPEKMDIEGTEDE